jgi:hypothetical protein
MSIGEALVPYYR